MEPIESEGQENFGKREKNIRVIEPVNYAIAVCLILLIGSFSVQPLAFRVVGDYSSRILWYSSTDWYESLPSDSTPSEEREFAFDGLVRGLQFSGLDDIFQTGPLNRGVRLERSGTKVALVVGDRRTADTATFIVSNALDTSRWHQIAVRIERSGRVIAWFDHAVTVDDVIPSRDYELSDLALGTGFSKTRLFRGSIVGTCEYTLYRSTWLMPALFALRVVLVVVLFGAIMTVLRSGKDPGSVLLPGYDNART